MSKYTAKRGMNYTPDGTDEEKRVEAGEDCSDLPVSAIGNLLLLKDIEQLDESFAVNNNDPED